MFTTKTTIKTLAAGALLATTILSSTAANAGNTGKHYFSLTGEYIASAKANGSVTASAGSAPISLDYKDGIGGLAAIGYYITDDFRTEIEGGYRELSGSTVSATIAGTKYTVDAGSVKSKALSTMVNVYYNLPTGTALSPYVGAGTGWVRETERGANALGYQAMAGVDYKVSANSTVFTGCRYFGTSDFTGKYTTSSGVVTGKASIKAHSIDVGYRYSF